MKWKHWAAPRAPIPGFGETWNVSHSGSAGMEGTGSGEV